MAKAAVIIGEKTPEKPEVIQIADRLGIHPDCALGVCVRFWKYCRDYGVDGALPLTASALDVFFGRPGFADALVAVGWLENRDSRLTVPNFDRYISQSALDRLDAATRQHRHRARDGCHKDVTKKRDKRVTPASGGNVRGGGDLVSPEEFSLNSEDQEKASRKKFIPPSVEDVKSYCAERNNAVDPVAFHAFYESKGWMIGKNKMVDWRKAVVTWERKSRESGNGRGAGNHDGLRQFLREHGHDAD